MGGKLELVHPNVGACNPREKGARIYLLKGHPNELGSGQMRKAPSFDVEDNGELFASSTLHLQKSFHF
jgi:hypothetical protein